MIELGIPEYTFILAMMMLPFAPSPLAILVYTQFAGTMIDMGRWTAFTLLLLVSQAVYMFKKESTREVR